MISQTASKWQSQDLAQLVQLFFFLSVFILRQREREREEEEEERESHAVSAEPDAGLNLTNREIMT